MKILKPNLLFVAISVFMFNCSNDDAPKTTVTTSDFIKSIDENSTSGTVLGSVEGSSNTGDVTFSINSQAPDGALAINTTTGELTIADAALFDFETNPTITATIKVANGDVFETTTITINLNDIDDIAFLLSDSKQTYKDAANGDWVEITEAEYNDLAQKLNNVSKVGTSDTEYQISEFTTSTFTQRSTANVTSLNIPANGYVFAFKYYINSVATIAEAKSSTTTNRTSSITEFRVKYSETIDRGYQHLGNKLPAHTGNKQSVYFVIKGNDTKVATESYLGIYNPPGVSIPSTGPAENYSYFSRDAIGNDFIYRKLPGRYHYQGLSTVQKQW